MQTVSVGVVGASGYSGMEATRLVAGHPGLELAFATSDRWQGEGLANRVGIAGSLRYAPLALSEELAGRCQAVVLATPPTVSLSLVPPLRARGIQIVDLSGAFRLKDAPLYPTHYGFEHSAPTQLAEAQYGLPELRRQALAGAALIANPGCYATAIALPRPASGRADRGGLDHCRCGFGGHRSWSQGQRRAGFQRGCRGFPCLPGASPSAHPGDREDIDGRRGRDRGPGLYAAPSAGSKGNPRYSLCATQTGVARFSPARSIARSLSERAFRGRARDTGGDLLATGERYQPLGELSIANDGRGQLVLTSALDNLLKGAAGQALQNLNLALGLPETLGLESLMGVRA